MKYVIKGNEIQSLEIELDPQEAILSETGKFVYSDNGIILSPIINSDGGLFGGLTGMIKRSWAGSSAILTKYENQSSMNAKLCLAPTYPGTIVDIDLSIGNVICQKGSFLGSSMGTDISPALVKKLGAGFFGGEGFILQKISGNGHVFIHAGGSLVKYELNGNKIRLEPGCLVGFQGDIRYDIEAVGGLSTMMFTGEKIFVSTLEGEGSVWIQTAPYSKIVDTILAWNDNNTNKDK